MPAYKFEALNADGKTTTGLLEGDTEKSVRSQLRLQKLVPLSVVPVNVSALGMAQGGAAKGAAEGAGSRWARRAFTPASLTVWTRQIAGLLTAGLPLERALTVLGDEAEDSRLRELLAHLKSEVNAGSS